MDFEAFVKEIETNKWNVFGVEVYEDGKLTHSYGDTTEKLHELYSATKTVLSIAVGIVYDMGLIDLEKSFLEYMPAQKLADMPANQKESFEKITIRRLLTMSVEGFPFRPFHDDPDGSPIDPEESWLDFALACEISDPEKIAFNYSNINSYLVSVALTEILGRDLGSFIEERIFKPLGIRNFEYKRCPEGYFYGASGMKLTVHDFSKIGLLLYNKGVYQGRRILSEKYDELATSVQMMNREGGYGYFVWKYLDGFSINGKRKQKCYVLPNRGLVISQLCDIDDTGNELRDCMEKHILGIGKDECITKEQYEALFAEIKPGFFEQEYVRRIPEEEIASEMLLDLKDFDGGIYRKELGEHVSFGYYKGDMEEFLELVKQVVPGWAALFNESSRIYCGFIDGKVASFCMIEDFGGHEIHGQKKKIGGPGCVGTLKEYRDRGIGLSMVREVTQILKDELYDYSYIHYTFEDKWYAKLGYRTIVRWNCKGIVE